MAKLSLLLQDTAIISTNLRVDPELGNLRTNSFDVEPGDTFICIKGESYDGHDFICIARERGAELIIAERFTPYLEDHPEIDYVIVKNTRLASALIWNNLCGRPSDKMIFIAVTGTNGKTSTTYFLKEIFSRAGYVTGLIGTVKCMSGDHTEIIGESGVNSMTTPPPEKLYPELKQMVDDGVEIVFLEASSHALAQYRLDPIRFELAIFTNLTPEHLDYHGDMENYFMAKSRLLQLSNCASVNSDDEWMAKLTDSTDIPVLTYSAKHTADFRAVNSCCPTDRHGIFYRLSERDIQYDIVCPIDGEFSVYNTLAAISAARLFGIKPEVIRRALENAPQIPGRMEMIPTDADFEICIDYAHTPDALKLSLETLKAKVKPGGRLITVFGCGGDRDTGKRPVMGRIASELADLVIITTDNSRSENPRSIIFDIVRGITERTKCRVIEKRDRAIIYALSEARKNDIILLAGKGHEDYEIDSTGRHPFSERGIITTALAARRQKN